MNNNTHILSSFLILLIVVGCNQQKEEPRKLQMTSSHPVNGTYTYTENGGVYSSVTISGSYWYGSLKICTHCDTEQQSGTVQNNILYDSSGFIQVGTIGNGNVRMSLGSGIATHTK